ncbi:MAG TPA: heparinase II/III family protein [Chitinophagaceae bacterium]|nr:heparinase II/III family protein [Chitinophagaceae bacterium]HPN58378.1 heparinase II/III family protein [Chitinophagaceae bacterium]
MVKRWFFYGFPARSVTGSNNKDGISTLGKQSNSMRIYFFILCFVALNSTAQTPRNLLQQKAGPGQLVKILDAGKDWIRYPAYKDRTEWDKLTGNLKSQLIKEGEAYLNYAWKLVTATQYLEYERSGNRTAMEDPAGSNNRALSRLIIAELAEGKGRFTDPIINGVWAACDMSSWVASAHLPVQQSKRSLPDFREEIIDLGSSDMGSFFSWTWYFLHEEFDKINPVISARLKQQIRQRILVPYMERNDFWWQALQEKPGRLVNNWNPWCNFNVLTCFLLIEDDPVRQAAGVYKTMQSTDQFINYVKEDGACEEGPSYWGHAAGKLYDYLELLSRATGKQIHLFEHPMIRNMGEYIVRSYVGKGWVVNFADASAKGGGDAGLIYRYGKAVNSMDMQSFAAYLVQDKKGITEITTNRDFFRTLENLSIVKEIIATKAALPTAAESWYPQTEFCYIKNNNGLFLAVKGGFNNESHNHNDAGTFSLYANETPFFIDAGVGTYTRQTFGPERYTIWTMQSEYHNLPLINGKPQVFGAQYKATHTRFDAAKKQFSTDLAKAYSNEAKIKTWIRNYTLEGNSLSIEDRFDLEATLAPNALHFLVWAQPVLVNEGIIQLEKEGTRLSLNYDKSIFSYALDTIPQTDKRLSNVWGETIYRIRLTAKKMQSKGNYRVIIRKE